MIRRSWMMAGILLPLAFAVSCASQQDTAGDFGGQPKDQAARERHHPQYPDSAQHLGPQEDQTATSSEAQQSGEQTEQERAAVSGVGK